MNWDAIGAVGEILGAGAVFASLIYLAIQIKSSAKVATAESEREVMSEWIEAIHKLWVTPEAASTNRRAFYGLDELNADERLTFTGDLGRIVTTHNMIWRMFESGLVEADMVDGCDRTLAGLLASAGGQRFWATTKSWYNQDYQSYVEAKVAAYAPYSMEDYLAVVLEAEPG